MQTRLLLESGDTLARPDVGGMVLWWDMEHLPRDRVGPGCSCLGREMVTGTNSGEKANSTRLLVRPMAGRHRRDALTRLLG